MYLRWAHATHHVLVKGRTVLAFRKHFLVKDLGSHLRNCLLSEEWEWLSRRVRGNSMSLESNLLHSIDGPWRLEVHMLGGIKRLFLRYLCTLDQGSRQFVGGSGGLLGRRANDYRRFHVDEGC